MNESRQVCALQGTPRAAEASRATQPCRGCIWPAEAEVHPAFSVQKPSFP